MNIRALSDKFQPARSAAAAVTMLFTLVLSNATANADRLHTIQDKNGPTLNIPGLPPIQLPPGTQVFGPNSQKSKPQKPGNKSGRNGGGQSDAANASKQADPKAAAGKTNKAVAKKPKGRDAILADLFNRLAKSKTRGEARGIVRLIQQVWLRSGSDTADLLMGRALKAVRKKNYKLALRLFDKMVLLEPRWAEVWHQRATARYNSNDPDGAVNDIARTLALETRHFSALVGLGFILRAGKQDKQALKVFRRALELNPHLNNVKKTIEKLKFAVEGQDI